MKAYCVLVGFVASFSAVAADLDAFDNGDFEDAAKYGRRGDRIEVARGFGFNGNGGAKISGNAKCVFKIPLKKSLKLKKGERYVFSMDVCNHSNIRKVSGGTISDQIALEIYNRATGKYEKSYYGCKFADIGNGWVHQELSFVPVADLDSEKQELRFFLLLEPGPRKPNSPPQTDEYVECDNAILKTCDPVWRFTNTWPTHNKIWKETGRIRAYSSFVGPFVPNGIEPEYAFELVTDRGDILATAKPENEGGVLTAAFGALDYEGPATLVATMFVGGKAIARRFREITVAPKYEPKPGEIVVTENGIAMVDGKPFMPLGFYSHFGDRKKYTAEEAEGHLRRLHDAGFNFLVDYCSWYLRTKEDRDWFYGLCAKYQMRVIATEFSSGWRDLASIPKFGEKAKTLAQYKPIIGWYLHDEARENGIPGLELSRRALNEATPGHITWGCNIFAPEPFLPTVDVQGGDDYPIVAGGGTLRDMYLRKKTAQATRPALGWYAPQAFNWGNYKYDTDALTNKATYEKVGHEPTENEILAIALTYASCGVSGFIFYAYNDIFKGPFPERPAERWETMKRIAITLRSLEPFITSGRPIVDLPHRDAKDESSVAMLRDGAGDIRVLVVGLGKEHETTFRISAGDGAPVMPTRRLKSRYGKIEVCEDGSCVFRGGAISCDILE